jgi:very-short-patch-repair endonuclease
MTERDPLVGQKIAPMKMQRAKHLRHKSTQAEDALWQCLRRNQLEGLHFRRQQIIDGFIADFSCHAAGVVIEVDGDIHVAQREYDIERDQILATHKLGILRFTNEDVLHNISDVLKTITLACNARIE